MRRAGMLLVTLLALAGCDGSSSSPPPTAVGNGGQRYAIRGLGDCDAVKDYPYARNLFCPAAFSAVASVRQALVDRIGGDGQARGVFYYYQTTADPKAPPDDQSQTTVACQKTRPPWQRATVRGAGAPLCRLLAYATSAGPLRRPSPRQDNPLPDALRAYPDYFNRLLAPVSLADFGRDESFDPLIRGLGEAGRAGFLRDYPGFAPDEIYDPAQWRADPNYHGISGGGGSGWGAEVVLERPGSAPAVLLAFGGGGGGGMTSTATRDGAVTRVGAGGGGGVQIADGYRFQGRGVDGLGLGAGTGSDETQVEYSYYDFAGSGRPTRPVHEYNPDVIADFQTHVGHVIEQLAAAHAQGATVVLRGGGGMGAGAEYLRENGDELVPHALSTQAGFRFRYEIAPSGDDDDANDALADPDEVATENAFAQLGEFYREATKQAYVECGRDYSNYLCMCPLTHAIVVCRMQRVLGEGVPLPVWLQQQHCPDGSVDLTPITETPAGCGALLDEH